MSSAALAQTASNAFAPAQPTGGSGSAFAPPSPTAAFLSDINILITGAALFGTGESPIWSRFGTRTGPVETVAFLGPALGLIEKGLGGREGVSVSALAVGKGSEPSLSLLGSALAFTGYLFLMAVYTLDEKFKRNATPGRLLAATASFYTCTKTAHGTSLHALLGLFLAAGGVLNALAVGLGDGNAVDLENRERERRRAVAAVARERRRVEGAKEKAE